MRGTIVKSGAFAIIEILIAITIISIVLTTIISGISAGIVAISGNRNLTIAMIIAKSKLNEFQIMRMRGPDIYDEAVKEYPGFYYSRRIKKFEHVIFGPIAAKRVEIVVNWKDRDKTKSYTISYIYPFDGKVL
jgi:type II secretory pathway pseudopilin PulG